MGKGALMNRIETCVCRASMAEFRERYVQIKTIVSKSADNTPHKKTPEEPSPSSSNFNAFNTSQVQPAAKAALSFTRFVSREEDFDKNGGHLKL